MYGGHGKPSRCVSICLYCLCRPLVCILEFSFSTLPSQSRELEDCAMGSCEKYITVAQPLILEAYLRPFHTVKIKATKLVGS